MTPAQDTDRREWTFPATDSTGEVSGLLDVPAQPVALYVFGHGAGAGMRHAFMESQSDELVRMGIATFRYNFPYMEQGRRPPNPRPILLRTVRRAVETAMDHLPDVPVIAGGKSMGGRMTSMAQAEEAIPGVRGLVFFGFPLHPAKKPGVERADHLDRVDLPMLFLQGSKDRLATLELLLPVLDRLGERAHLELVDDADHGFHVPKRTGKTDLQVREELAATVLGWTRGRLHI